MTRRRWLALGGLPVLAGIGLAAAREGGALGGSAKPRFTPTGPGTARAQIQERHLPNVPLVTHRGDPVHFYDDLVKDKKVVLSFVSGKVPETHRVAENLATMQGFFGKRVGKDIFLYSISRTPESDSPAALRRLASRYDAGPGWTFLTGAPKDVERLRRGLGFASEIPAEDADPAYAVGLIRHGIEPEMRWAHCQALAPPRVIAHALLLDFGQTDPAAPPIWECERLLSSIR